MKRVKDKKIKKTKKKKNLKTTSNIRFKQQYCSNLSHSSTEQTKIPVFLEIIFSLIQCMVTAIQADPEVAFRKLPSKEFFMFYFIASKSD